MIRRKNTKGFSMAELMLVVAIIAILSTLAIVGVARYLRGLRLLEMDNAAKEMYFAAQNRITAALVSGDLGRLKESDYSDDVKTKMTKTVKDGTKDKSVTLNVIKVSKLSSVNTANTLLDELLPFGSIDETLRANGSYIITYTFDADKNVADVWDVWYTSDDNSGIFRSWSGSENTLLTAKNDKLAAARISNGDEGRKNRLHFPDGGGDAVIGHYGSNGVSFERQKLAVEFELKNEEVLYLTGKVTDGKGAFPASVSPQVNLIVEGLTSGAVKTLMPDTSGKKGIKLNDDGTFYFVLDDVAAKDKRFRDQFIAGDADPSDPSAAAKSFIPGEDIRVTVEVYSNSSLATIERATAVDNSLFQYVKTQTNAGKTTGEAGIGNIRHLQNLSSEVSNVVLGVKNSDTQPRLGINSARQNNDLDWNTFKNYTRPDATKINGDIWYNEDNSASVKNTTASFLPIKLMAEAGEGMDLMLTDQGETQDGLNAYLHYNAGYIVKQSGQPDESKRHKIANLTVNGVKDAGLFGIVGTDSTLVVDETKYLLRVMNLDMTDAVITGDETAGTVAANVQKAAMITGVSVSNATVAIADNKTGNAGGVVGKAVNGLDVLNTSVTDSGVTAAGGNAGGLVGDFSESGDASTGVHLQISNSYVVNKDGDKPVTGNVAGGLVGMLKAAFPQFTKSYSTAIVSGTEAAGGLVGTLQNSYNGTKGKSYIYGCYVGGHVETKENKPVYSSENFNVTATGTAGSAGGFFGKVVANKGALNVEACYSTASARGDTAGGFVGKVEGNGAGQYSVSNCYAVGLVKDTTPDTTPSGAFGGDGAYGLAFNASMNNLYFELINGSMPAVVTPENRDAKTGIIAAESSLGTYNAFFVNDPSKVLDAYNSKLTDMFKSVYFLPTVQTLADNANGSAAVKALNTENPLTTHVGDWQPVDTLVINTPDGT